jgi:hypothetical protein
MAYYDKLDEDFEDDDEREWGPLETHLALIAVLAVGWLYLRYVFWNAFVYNPLLGVVVLGLPIGIVFAVQVTGFLHHVTGGGDDDIVEEIHDTRAEIQDYIQRLGRGDTYNDNREQHIHINR